MSTGPAGGPYHTSEDEQILHRLGYAQELFRAMGGFQNFAISFTIISILAGCLTSYYVAFERGGPVAVTWGWLLVGLMSTIIALAMAEIASAYPTAGGLYYWASKLGSPGWGWATGWFNLDRPGRRHRRRSAMDWPPSAPRCSTTGSPTRSTWATGSAWASTAPSTRCTRSSCSRPA